MKERPSTFDHEVTFMMTKRLRAVTLAAAFAAAAPAALADTGKRQPPPQPQQAKEYFRCAATPAVHFQGTIVDAALATPDLKVLADAVVAAGLAGTLAGPGPFTVYAPTNAAFQKIPPAVLSAITSDTALLTAVLTYHVTPGKGRDADPRLVFNTPKEVPTVQGQTVFFSRSTGPQVNQSNVACQPVRTTNGVVWLIDSVLLPQF
jgi:uncharacterized surface protein with fasciclin (FAS1) repeats